MAITQEHYERIQKAMDELRLDPRSTSMSFAEWLSREGWVKDDDVNVWRRDGDKKLTFELFDDFWPKYKSKEIP